jgi:hypothetical protein
MALNKNIAKAIKRRQENELRENNKLIAEFMGLIIRDEEGDLPVSSQQHKLFIEEEWGKLDICSPYSPNGVDYHTSWDYLMPVVEKIGKEVAPHFDEIVGLGLLSTRNQVYRAVVEYIKEYNKKKED